MGQKVYPIGLRLGINQTWGSKWYADKDYAQHLQEDLWIRNYIKRNLQHAGISRVDIERAALKVKVHINTSRPGIVIGKKGAEALGEVVPGAEPAALIFAASTLALQVGAMLLVARVFRLGFVANFISDPVLTGFKAGVGLGILLDQAPKLLGVHYAKAGSFRDLASLLGHLPETSLMTLAVGLATLLVILGLEHFAPRAPSPLIVVGVGIAASSLLGLQAAGVGIVGHIPGGLPVPVWPHPSLFQALWPAARSNQTSTKNGT